MYKKLIGLCFVVLTFSGAALATEFTEGDYYIEIKGQFTKHKEVREHFSFYCPHCFNQEPTMHDIKASLPADATFVKNHVDGMPGQKPEIEKALTKALITADMLKVKSKIVAAIFNYIHVNKAKFDSVKDIKNLFLLNGVDGDRFDKTFGSFAVNVQAKKMFQKTANIRKQGIGTVPTLIINGKYKPVMSKLKSMDEYKALIGFLLNKTA